MADNIPTFPSEATAYNPLSAVEHPSVTNPILTGGDTSKTINGNAVDSLADPSLFFDDDGTWYIWFEGFDSGTASDGRVGYATSTDGLNYTIQGFPSGLDDGNHMAFPTVFKRGGNYYMIPHREDPDGDGNEELELWQASSFPTGWSKVATLWEASQINDPTYLYWNGKHWILFGVSGTNEDANLIYSDTIDSGYSAHPSNPVITPYGRPAGRPIVRDNYIIHFGMEQSTQVHGHLIDTLTTSSFSSTRIKKIEEAGGASWYSSNFHNWSAWSEHDLSSPDIGWLVACDGNNGSDWSIGLFQAQPNRTPWTDYAFSLIDNGLTTRYEFEDDSDTTVAVDTAGGRSAAINGPTYTTDAQQGSLALDGDGSNDYVNINGLTNDYSAGDPISITFWLEPDSTGASTQRPLDFGNVNGAKTGISFYVLSGSLGLQFADGSRTTIGTASITADTAYAVAATFDGSTAHFYVDGNEIANTSTTYTLGSTARLFQGADGAAPFDGTEDDVRFYTRKLSASEVQSIASKSG